ncbi:MAG: C40 family peptidase [Saprospiraceae bacterium]
MKILIFGWLVVLSNFCNQPEPAIPSGITDAILTVEKKFAPDKRTVIFKAIPHLNQGHWVISGESNDPKATSALLTALKTYGVIDSIELLPSKALHHKIYGIVTIPVANMRSATGHNSELSNQALCGTLVRIFKSFNGWYYCQTPDDYLGWIDEDAIQPMDSAEINAWTRKRKVIVTSDQSYVVQAPISGSNVVSPLSVGAILPAGTKSKGYYPVIFADGRRGFIPSNNVMDLNLWKIQQAQTLSSDGIIKSAFSFLGRPYLWGGTSGNGMDCSGFTKMIFFEHGLLLPRDASQQVKVGLAIETDSTLKNLIPGDFLFFGRKAGNNLPEKVTHVAIYVGDGKIIHATGFIQEQSLRRGDSTFVEHRLQSLLRATRPLAAPKEHGIFALADLKYYD